MQLTSFVSVLAHMAKTPERYRVTVSESVPPGSPLREIGTLEIEHKHVKDELAQRIFDLGVTFATSIVKKTTYMRQLGVWLQGGLKDVDFFKTASITLDYGFRDDGDLRIVISRS
jgi:hypothetical protein